MPRRLHRFLAILLLAAALACAALHWIGHYYFHMVRIGVANHFIGVASFHHSIYLIYWPDRGQNWKPTWFHVGQSPGVPIGDGGYGLRWGRAPHIFFAGIPPALLAIPFATAAIFLWRRGRRPLPGLCRLCGYDLRASKDRCPECGAALT